jgi:hypothetical protein
MSDAETNEVTPQPTTPRRLVPPAVLGALVVSSIALVVAHYTVALIAAVASGKTGGAARGDALVRWGLSAWLPVALAACVLLARRTTRTREHLMLGSFFVLGVSLAFFGRHVLTDLEAVRERASAPTTTAPGAEATPESAFEGLAAGCRDGCPADVAMTVCQRFCACLVDEVRRSDLTTQDRLLTHGDEPAVQQEMAALALRCPGNETAPTPPQ